MKPSPSTIIAKRLGKMFDKPMDTVSHVWLCQMIAYDLKKAGHIKDSYRFSKLCGYKFDITK